MQEAARNARVNVQAIQRTELRARQMQYRRRRNRQSAWSDSRATVAWLIWHFTSSAEAVRLYATARLDEGGARRGPESAEDAVQEIVRDARGRSQAERALAARPQPRVVFRAALASAELRVLMFVAAANARGVAVSARQLVREVRSRWPPAGRNASAVAIPPAITT